MQYDLLNARRARAAARRLPFAAAAIVGSVLALTAGRALRPAPALAASPQDANPGKDVYDMKCGGCHDNGATGPDLHGLYDRKTFVDGTTPVNDDTVRSRILKGTDVMPAFADQLSKDQVDALIGYLHTLK